MLDLVVRLVEHVVHSHCCPGVNHFSNWTAPLHGAPPVGSTWELHLHKQQAIFQRD